MPTADRVAPPAPPRARSRARAATCSAAFAPQASLLLSGGSTVLDAVCYGDATRPRSAGADVLRATAAAEADAFVRDLPDQYLSVVGEGGDRLSGGQRSRLSIARALRRADAKLWLLDEPTAARRRRDFARFTLTRGLGPAARRARLARGEIAPEARRERRRALVRASAPAARSDRERRGVRKSALRLGPRRKDRGRGPRQHPRPGQGRRRHRRPRRPLQERRPQVRLRLGPQGRQDRRDGQGRRPRQEPRVPPLRRPRRRVGAADRGRARRPPVRPTLQRGRLNTAPMPRSEEEEEGGASYLL